ncbi:MAG: TolC family protein [Acidobacteria bacterium]|nr:TolC family protein [Acidobacteriota bacterium]
MNRIMKLSSILFFFSVSGAPAAAPSGSSGEIPSPEARILTVREAVQMALSRSPQMLQAEAQAMGAKEAARESRSLNRPQVYAGSGLAYNNGMPLSIEGAAPSIFQVRASQAVFSKKNNNLIREAEENGAAARFNRESAGNDLACRTALAYFTLHQARRMIALAGDRLQAALAQKDMAQSLFLAGRISPAEAASAKTAVSAARQQRLVFEEQAGVAEMELRSYTGLSGPAPIHTLEPQIKAPAVDGDAEALYRQALENSPEIAQAEADIRSREFRVEAERGERLPKLDLVGQYALLSDSNNYTDYFNRFERNNYLLGISIQVPVFDGFRTSARIARSRHELYEARCRLESLKSELNLATRKGLSALRIARGAREHARNEVEALGKDVRASEVLLESGRISRKDLEEIRTQLLQKEFALLEAEQNLFQSKIELLGIIGSTAAAFQ